MKIFTYAALAALLFAGTGCSNFSHKKTAAASTVPVPKPVPNPPPKHSFWNGDAVTGAALIQIVLSQQRAYFFKGEQLVGASVISSGKKGFETPPGTYKVIQKDKKHVSNLYGDYVDDEGAVVQANVDISKDPKPEEAVAFVGAKMPNFLRFTGGYGMHAGHLPGYRASHGCVRMPGAMAAHFFDATEIGMPVIVQP